MTYLLSILPRKKLSRFVGKLMHLEFTYPLNVFFISLFAFCYRIRISEAEKALGEYPSIGKFFSRKLKPGLRPIAEASAVHPADSAIIQSGPILKGTLIQAKGIKYNLLGLTEDPDCLIKYGDGFYITYYLCPTDYHRVHSPTLGYIKSVTYKNGDLWPVNMGSVRSISNLYVVNERLVIEMATEFGAMAVVMVGATNVGSMSLAFDPKIQTNVRQKSKRKVYESPLEVEKGEELGTFHMGSTVILLLSPEFRQKFENKLNLQYKVKVGEALISQSKNG